MLRWLNLLNASRFRVVHWRLIDNGALVIEGHFPPAWLVLIWITSGHFITFRHGLDARAPHADLVAPSSVFARAGPPVRSVGSWQVFLEHFLAPFLLRKYLELLGLLNLFHL